MASDVSLEKPPASTQDPDPLQIVRVRALHAAAQLPAILDLLSQNGLQAGEMSLRANTLEDVFIQLTGRRLRE